MEHLFGLLDEAETGAETDVAALERLLWRRFGRKGAAFVLDMAGTSRAVRERGIVPMLLRIRRMQRLGVPIVISRNGVTQMGYELAGKLGMALFGRASQRHFICYCGFERFDAEPEPERPPVRIVT